MIGVEGFKIWVMIWWQAKDYRRSSCVENGMNVSIGTWAEKVTRNIGGHVNFWGVREVRRMNTSLEVSGARADVGIF
jgi:hypothetical protein